MSRRRPQDLAVLPFYHGALPEQDALQMLVRHGDYMLLSRVDAAPGQPDLVLLVRNGQTVRKVDIARRSADPAFCVAVNDRPEGVKRFPSIQMVIREFSGDNDLIPLRRPVNRGRFALVHNDVQMMRKIGSGAYGAVYCGRLTIAQGHKRLVKEVAIKRIMTEGKNETALMDMMNEAKMMQMFQHVNIVQFYGFVLDRSPYLLVMELCQDGSVEEKLRSDGHAISAARRVDMATQASRGMEYLHQKKCIHRDIATRNCLLKGPTLKLADFGMCRATEIYRVDLSKPQNVRWLAPEVWRTGDTKLCTDVYAFGIMLWELFVHPYTSPYAAWKAVTVKEQVMLGYRMPTPDMMPKEVADLTRQCWHQEPDSRPTASELKEELNLVNKEFNAYLYEIVDKSCKTAVTQSPHASSISLSLQLPINPSSHRRQG